MSTTRTVLVIALMVTFTIAHGQTTWYIDDDNACPGSDTQMNTFCTIQAGIYAASDGDEVVVAPGEYFENINLMGKAITVRSTTRRFRRPSWPPSSTLAAAERL